MKNYGDITQISGWDVPPTEVVIGGSPCQDLSIAGKRAGLSGARSRLFLEQIRIIKEMRQADVNRGRDKNSIRPRYMVWENVPGALSSHGGTDFLVVLEETAKIVSPTAIIPRPPKGKWTNAGAIVADGWSIAWRILDAQFWGVPQRRLESHLSQILEAKPPRKYYLSAKTCLGILRRAEHRGKELPRLLKKALEEQE